MPKETLEFIDALFKGYWLENKVMENGKIDPGDIFYVMQAVPTLWKGFVGVKYIDDELAELTDEGRAQIRAKIEEFVYAEDEEIEEIVEEVLAMIFNMVRVGALVHNKMKK